MGLRFHTYLSKSIISISFYIYLAIYLSIFVTGSGFEVWGLGLRCTRRVRHCHARPGQGCGVWGVRFVVWGVGCGVEGLGFRVRGSPGESGEGGPESEGGEHEAEGERAVREEWLRECGFCCEFEHRLRGRGIEVLRANRCLGWCVGVFGVGLQVPRSKGSGGWGCLVHGLREPLLQRLQPHLPTTSPQLNDISG